MAKFKIGDKVRIKSNEWYEKNKDGYGDVYCSNGVTFIPEMRDCLGRIVTIEDARKNGIYYIEEFGYIITDDMLEDCVLDTDKQEEIALKELITTSKPNIDWEQRRYELAKAAMQSFVSLENIEDFVSSSTLVTCSIYLADEMIKQLKHISS